MPSAPRLHRLDDARVRGENPHGVEPTLFANGRLPVEPAAATELVGLPALRDTVGQVAAAPGRFDQTPDVVRVALAQGFLQARGSMHQTHRTRGYHSTAGPCPVLSPRPSSPDWNCPGSGPQYAPTGRPLFEPPRVVDVRHHLLGRPWAELRH